MNNNYINGNDLLNDFDFKFASNFVRYELGETIPSGCENIFDGFKKHLKEKGLSTKEIVFAPIYVYIHSGIVFSTNDFKDKWDSNIAGYIWIEKKEYLKKHGYKRFSKKMNKIFENETEEFITLLNNIM